MKNPSEVPGASPRLLLAAGLYIVAVVVPLFVILLGPESVERGFWIEFVWPSDSSGLRC